MAIQTSEDEEQMNTCIGISRYKYLRGVGGIYINTHLIHIIHIH